MFDRNPVSARARRDVGKALGLPEDLTKMLSSEMRVGRSSHYCRKAMIAP
jgi:hypothetical protein